MHYVAYILLSSWLLCIVTANGYLPIDQNFINIIPVSDTNKVNYRLPNNTRPEHYVIALATNVDKNDFNFTGQVAIKLRTLESTKNITVHQRQLTIDSVSLQNLNTLRTIKVHHNYDNITEFLVISAADELEKEQHYLLTIAYHGELRTDMGGFYRSSYTNSKNETRLVQYIICCFNGTKKVTYPKLSSIIILQFIHLCNLLASKICIKVSQSIDSTDYIFPIFFLCFRPIYGHQTDHYRQNYLPNMPTFETKDMRL